MQKRTPSLTLPSDMYSPKSASYWTFEDLAKFNIKIQDAELHKFSNLSNLPPSPLKNSPLWNLSALDLSRTRTPLTKEDKEFFFYLSAVEEQDSKESAVDDLTAYILRKCITESSDLYIRQRPILRFNDIMVPGQKKHAVVNFVLVDDNLKILGLQ